MFNIIQNILILELDQPGFSRGLGIITISNFSIFKFFDEQIREKFLGAIVFETIKYTCILRVTKKRKIKSYYQLI